MFYFHWWLVMTAAKLIRATFSVTYSGHVTTRQSLLHHNSHSPHQGQTGNITQQQKLLIGIISTFVFIYQQMANTQAVSVVFRLILPCSTYCLQWMKMWFYPAVRPTTNQQK